MRRIICGVLAFFLTLSLCAPVLAAGNSEAISCIQHMVNYYRCYQDEAQVDLERLNAELAGIDEALAGQWREIMDYWSWINRDMDYGASVLPDGLPEDDSLCIVVLGYELNANGTMRDELIGRLEAALASAQKYPNAYIACTGGGTARNSKYITEAGQMAAWLTEQGIDESRIIVEKESISTVQNAQFTCDILQESYPQVQHLAVITSDYHLARGALLFQAESVLSGYALDVVGVAAYQTDKQELENLTVQATDLATLSGIPLSRSGKPKLSELTELTVTGDTQCEAGMELDLQVFAVYSSGYTKNVTMYANYSGFDMALAGNQTVTVKYTENGTVYTTSIDIEFLPRATEIPATEPAVAAAAIAEETEPNVTETPEESENPPLILIITILILLLALLVILTMKKYLHG